MAQYQIDVTFERRCYYIVDAASEEEAENRVNQRIINGDEEGDGEYFADTLFDDVYELVDEEKA